MLYSTTTRTATNCQELINFKVRGISLNFMSTRDVIRFCYDTDTAELRMLGVFGWVRRCLVEYGKIQLRYTKMYWEIRDESVKNTPKSSTNHLRKGNSWQFLKIRQNFSLKLGIKCH